MLFLVEMFSWILPILAVLVLLIVIAAGYVKAAAGSGVHHFWVKERSQNFDRPGGYPGPVF